MIAIAIHHCRHPIRSKRMEASLSEALAVSGGRVIVLAGKEHPVSLRTLTDWAEVDKIIADNRGSPFRMLGDVPAQLKDSPAAMQALARGVTEGARNWRVVTDDEHFGFLQSFEGFLVRVWLAVRRNDPQTLTRSNVAKTLCAELDELQAKGGTKLVQARMDAINAVIDVANNEDEVGNSQEPSQP
jgi:hypothetical protein